MAKEDIPFELLEILNPIVNQQKRKVTFTHYLSEKNEIVFKSTLFDGKFFFNIKYIPNSVVKTSYGVKNQYTILFYPESQNTLKESTGNKIVKDLSYYLNSWFATLDKFENTKTFLDDPILETYKKDVFENTLKFVDEDDDDKPFPLESQINFIHYLNHLEKVINDEIMVTETTEDKANLRQSLNTIEEIRTNINKLTKGEVKSKFSMSLAYIAKASLKFFKSITTEIIKEVAVKALIGN